MSLAALGLYALLARRARRPLAIWVWIAAAVTVVSLAGPAGATTLGGGVALATNSRPNVKITIPGLEY